MKKRKTGIKKKRKEYIKKAKHQRTNVRTITLKCKECKRVYKINTTKPEIYTEEVKKNWLCLTHQIKRKRNETSK